MLTLSFGAFGKIPGLGDFFQVNVPRAFLGAWDAWLQRGLMAGRTELGPRWNGCYNTAPLWRFTLPARVAGPDPMIGVLMPSVDRVGRQFPLTLVAALPDDSAPLAAHLRATRIFEALEDVALDALEGALQRADLEARLAAVPAGLGWPSGVSGQYGRAFYAARADEAGALPDLAAALIAADRPRLGYWSAQLDGAARTLAFDGLPEDGAIRMLFDISAPVWTAHA